MYSKQPHLLKSNPLSIKCNLVLLHLTYCRFQEKSFNKCACTIRKYFFWIVWRINVVHFKLNYIWRWMRRIRVWIYVFRFVCISCGIEIYHEDFIKAKLFNGKKCVFFQNWYLNTPSNYQQENTKKITLCLLITPF